MEKKKNRWFVVIGAAALTVICLCIAIGSMGSGGDTKPRATSKPTTYRVSYTITGSAESVSVTYQNAQGNTEQGSYKLPFKKNFTMEYGQFAYISAQNNGRTGSVICTIYVNDAIWQTATSKGAFVIADCSGLVGK